MGKLENNKQQKRTSLLDTAFKLFTTQGVSKTSIAEISQKAGIAKGTFYLYFKDKYDIRNKLVSHEASKLFKNAVNALELHIKEQQINDHSFTITFTEEIIFIADHIINVLNTNQTLLTFISKNLSWGIFKEALTTNVADDDINFKDIYYEMLEDLLINNMFCYDTNKFFQSTLEYYQYCYTYIFVRLADTEKYKMSKLALTTRKK